MMNYAEVLKLYSSRMTVEYKNNVLSWTTHTVTEEELDRKGPFLCALMWLPFGWWRFGDFCSLLDAGSYWERVPLVRCNLDCLLLLTAVFSQTTSL